MTDHYASQSARAAGLKEDVLRADQSERNMCEPDAVDAESHL